MTTLYRKYRPQSFKDLAGQEHIVQSIMNEVAMGKVAHAYLFAGPRGVGKTTMARLLAKAVNCEKRTEGESEPCNECTSCQEITNGRHIDVLEIDAASQTGVDNVRENIIESAQFKPTKAKFKIFIIDEVHMLSNSAFNALLKTLEEPPAHVIFILATTELHKLPATVISRCQRFTFKKIAHDEILKTLKDICKQEGVKVDEEVLSRVIAKSDGGLRDAESLLGQILSLNLKKITIDDIGVVLPASHIEEALLLLTLLCEKKTAEALGLVAGTAGSGLNIDQFMLDCLELARLIMVCHATHATPSGAELSREQASTISKLAAAFSGAGIVALLDSLLKRRLDIRTSPVPTLPLELLIVEFTQGTAPTTTADPSSKVGEAPEPKKAAAHNSIEPKPVVEASSQDTSTPTTPTTKVGILPQQSNVTIEPLNNGVSSKTAIQTTFDTIKARWNDLIIKIGETNHSLTFVLKSCQPTAMTTDGLQLTVPFSLHKEKLEEPKSRRVIEEAMQHLFAERIPVLCTIASVAQSNSDLTDVAASFGGEVIN